LEELEITELNSPVPNMAMDMNLIRSGKRWGYIRGKCENLGGNHWWFGPGCIARGKANYLIWYPAYSIS
jgi:hypothetical protein